MVFSMSQPVWFQSYLLKSHLGEIELWLFEAPSQSLTSCLLVFLQGTGYFILVIQLYSRMYTIVLAWALLYIVYCFRDPLPWSTCSGPWNTGQGHGSGAPEKILTKTVKPLFNC